MKKLDYRIIFRACVTPLLLLWLLQTTLMCAAQAQTPKLVPVYTKVSSYILGYYETLPVNYASAPSKKFPLLIFLHGKGELGNGSAAQLGRVSNVGVARLIKDGKFPASFTVNGETHSFIVISPQITTNAYSSAGSFIGELLAYCKQHYRVDESRIYITGLSMGGGMTWRAAAVHAATFAAVLPICGSASFSSAEAKAITSAALPVWATHNNGDPTVSVVVTQKWYAALQANNPNPQPKMTIFDVASHDAWTKTYDPSFKENGLNAYEWMLSYKRGSSTSGTVAQPTATVSTANPVAEGGPDLTVTLPVNFITLNADRSTTPAGTTITSYQWKKVAGGTAIIQNPSGNRTDITGLQEGSYIFYLTIVNSEGKKSTDRIDVFVKAPASPPIAVIAGPNAITLPVNNIILEGSGSSSATGSVIKYAWAKMSGPSAVIVNDTLVKTNITGLTAGTYVFKLTVTNSGGLSATAEFSVTVSAAAVVVAEKPAPIAEAGADKIVTLPVTSTQVDAGNSVARVGRIISFAWKKISGGAAIITNPTSAKTAITHLEAGHYQFEVTVTSDNGKRSKDTARVTVNNAASARKSTADSLAYENSVLSNVRERVSATTISAYPNPFVSMVYINIVSHLTGQGKIGVYDVSGRLLLQQSFNKTNSTPLVETLHLSRIPAGTYFIKVILGNTFNEHVKIVKQ